MLTPETIDRIIQLAKSGATIDPDIENVAVLPKDMQIHDLERFRPYRDQFRGAFTTRYIEQFCEYVFNHTSGGDLNNPRPSIFISSTDPVAKAYLDIGNIKEPGHCHHKAILKMDWTPEWLSIPEGKITQSDLIDWISDHNELIRAFDREGNVIQLSAAITALRTITIGRTRNTESSVQENSAARTDMERIDAKSLGEEPRDLVFTCPPIEELAGRDVTLRLQVAIQNSDQKEVILRIRWIRKERTICAIFEEFAEKIRESMEAPCNIYIGSFADK